MTRLSVGIDVSEKSLDVAYWDQKQDEAIFIGKFPNTPNGFQAIERKIEKKRQKVDATIVHVVMEPTGGYEQPFAHFADQQEGWRVSLPNPLYPKQWSKATGKRAKTDKQDAKTLAHFGFVCDPLPWKPLPPEVEQLSHLLDRLDDLEDMLNREKNRLHSSAYHVNPHKAACEDLTEGISSLKQRIQHIQDVIKEHLEVHPHLKEQKKLLLSIPGVGEKNVLYILVMMHRWGVLTSYEGDAKGLVAYLGLDPKPHESGASTHKRARISRQGNRPLRSRLYMGALGGIKGKNSPLRAFYKGLVGKGKAKKLALVAAARKILVWCWAVFRSNTPFDTARFENLH